MTGKAYIVFKGSYSSRGIVAVFSNKDLAETFVKNHNANCTCLYYDEYDIEVWDVDSFDERVREGLSYFSVCVAYDGEVSKPKTIDVNIKNTKVQVEILDEAYFDREDGNDRFHYDTKKAICVSCWARNAEHALKIATDKRKEMLAKGEIVV